MRVTVNVIKPGATPNFDGWRCQYTPPHENGNYNPPGMPTATPSLYNFQKVAPPIVFTKPMQDLAYAVCTRYNSEITYKRISMIYDRNVIFTNTQGWGLSKDGTEYIHRRNYFLNEGLTSEYAKLEDAIICAGSFYRLQDRNDGHLWAVPGVTGIDVNKTLPDVETIFNNNWYFYCTNNTTKPSHFAQGQGGPVIVPFFLTTEVPYMRQYFHRWQGDTLPDPLTIYV